MRLLTLFTLLSLAVSATSATVQDLYDVRVPVADQTAESRTDALGGAFSKMLVKVSGTSVVLENNALLAEQATASEYVSSLRYERDDEGNLMLSVSFMADPVQKLLENSGAPLWGASRPMTQLWLAVSEDGERVAIGPEEDDWRLALNTAMKDRGLPYILPTWDLEDQMALPLASLWGLFEQDIEAATKRYSSEGYLAGRITAAGGYNSFSGYLTYGNQQIALSLQGETPEELAGQLAAAIAEHLSEKYAVIAIPGADGGHILRVAGINTFADYHAVLTYLKGHVAVRDAVMLGSHGNELTVSLDLSGAWPQVWDVLALDARLAESEEEPGLYIWQQ